MRTRIVRPNTCPPVKLSTASTVDRWSSYMTNAKPLGFPVSLSRGMLISATSPNLTGSVVSAGERGEERGEDELRHDGNDVSLGQLEW